MRTRSKSREYRRKCEQLQANMDTTPSPPIPKLPTKLRGRHRSRSQPALIPLTDVEAVPAKPLDSRVSSPKRTDKALGQSMEVIQQQPVRTVASTLSIPDAETCSGLEMLPNVGKRSVSPGEGVRSNKAFELRAAARPQ